MKIWESRKNFSVLRSTLIERICKRQPHFKHEDVQLVVRLLLDHISLELAQGGRIEIRRFGVFETRIRRARSGRNPKTGISVSVPSRRIPRFRPSPALLRRHSRVRTSNHVEAALGNL